MGWPQWVIAGLYLFALGVAAAEHGKPRSPSNFIHTLIGVGLQFWLLWMGGFFSQ